jgi:hypothetical protein
VGNPGTHRYKGGVPRNDTKGIKKNEIKPWQSREWRVPPKRNAEGAAGMEDVLDVYTRRQDERHPVVCVDECLKQLIEEKRVLIPAEPAKEIKKLADEDFPEAEKIALVMDNPNTHSTGSLYETYPVEEARRIKETHYMPKHGSWLNLAEIELSVISNQGLSERIPAIEQTRREARAWNEERNKKGGKINQRFTTADARIKLKRLYPNLILDCLLAVCCASRTRPRKIGFQPIFYPTNCVSSPIIGDFLRHQAQKIHKCNRLLVD